MSEKQKFLLQKAIEYLGYNWEEFKKEHIYIGSDKNSRYPYFLQCCLRYPQFNLIPPPKQKQCMCTTEIVEQCWIMNINNGNILVIGNECIKHFDFDTKRYCTCGKSLNNSKYQECKNCRIKKNYSSICERSMQKKQGNQLVANGDLLSNCIGKLSYESIQEYNERIKQLSREIIDNSFNMKKQLYFSKEELKYFDN